MLILKKIILSFLLPPGIFVSILLIISCWYFFKRNIKTGLVNCALALIVWVFSTTFFSSLLYMGLEVELNPKPTLSGDIIIFLTGGSTLEGHTRLLAVAKLQRNLDIPVIISGERKRPKYCYAQKSNEKYLIELGVQQSRIIVEAESRNTIENAKQVSKIIKKHGYNTPILVTSQYHLKRAILAFDKVGIQVIPYITAERSKNNVCYNMSDFLPKTFIHTSAALKEYLGLIFYHFDD